ncbi:MAG: glycerophosphodiester phosphodiesterase family protein [Gammaproteobacteria bacterium]|nr:glycerophosphodiester phosphodiesterase family protein [Gammaproteobacteria bacterium]
MAIPHLVAHRGHMETYPENTLLSLEAAMQCGASHVEFDVQCTADGKLVVFHDAELERTTGVKGNLFQMAYEELENIRAHEPERFSLAFFKSHIPSLTDVVRLLQRYPRVTAFVEIKEESLEQFGVENTLATLYRELEIIHQQCVIISYHYPALQHVKDNTDYHTGWILRDYDSNNRKLAEDLKPDYLIINHRKLPENEEPWPGSWHWMVYDITDPELAIHYASLNIPLIETRDICNMLEHPLLALNVDHQHGN